MSVVKLYTQTQRCSVIVEMWYLAQTVFSLTHAQAHTHSDTLTLQLLLREDQRTVIQSFTQGMVLHYVIRPM